MKMVTRACEVREVGRKTEESNSKKSKRWKIFKDEAVVDIGQTKREMGNGFGFSYLKVLMQHYIRLKGVKELRDTGKKKTLRI